MADDTGRPRGFPRHAAELLEEIRNLSLPGALGTCALWLAVIALLIYLLRTAEPVVLPIVLGWLIAMLFWPLLVVLRRLHLPQPVGAAVILVLVVGTLAGSLYGLSAPAADWIRRAPSSLHVVEYRLRALKKPIEELKQATESVENATSIESKKKPGNVTVKVKERGYLEVVADALPGAMQQTLVTLMALYFFLAFGDGFLRRSLSLLSSSSMRTRIADTMREVQHDVSRYLATITTINIGLGALVGTMLYLFGFPNPALWAVSVALLNFAPYVGSLIALAGIFIVGIVSFDTLTPALTAAALFALMTTVEGYFVTPAILGRRLALDPLLIFLSMVAWGWLWGVTGLLMAVPLLVCGRIVWQNVLEERERETRPVDAHGVQAST